MPVFLPERTHIPLRLATFLGHDRARSILSLSAQITSNGTPAIRGQVALALDASLTTSALTKNVTGSTSAAFTFDIRTQALTQSDGLYSSLIRQDRPIAWWGLDRVLPLNDDSTHAYTLTAVGSPAAADPLVVYGEGSKNGARTFNGASDAYTTPGTLYAAPTQPPAFQTAIARAGTTNQTMVESPSVQAGDLELACLVHADTSAAIVGVPSGWAQLGTTFAIAGCTLAVFRRIPTQDEIPLANTWTWSVSGQSLGVLAVYRGCDPDVTDLIYDYGQTGTVSGTSHNATLENHPAQSHVITFWVAETTATISPSTTGLKSRANVAAGNVKIALAEYDAATAGASYTMASTDQAVALGAFTLTFGSPDTVADDTLDALASGFSAHLLVKPDTVSGQRTLIRKHGSWGLRINAGTLEFLYTDGGGTERTATGPSLSAGVTTQVVVADDGTNVNFYKDTVRTQATREGAAGYQTNSEPVVIGAYRDGTGVYSQYFDGTLDEVAIYGAPLSQQMIDTYYQAGFVDGSFGQFLHPVNQAAPVYPRAKLEIAFRSAPTDETFVWEDVTDDLRSTDGISIQRGRNFELDRIETGRMDFTLSNRNRQYDDTYPLSPYYPYVVPTRPVRLRAQVRVNEPVYEIFFGYTEGHPLLRPNLGWDAKAHFVALDAFKALTLDKVQGAFVRNQELSGARLQALLDGFPGVPFEGEAGQSEIVADDLAGMNALDHAQQVTETESGVLFASTGGTIVFQDRHHRVVSERSVRASYGEGGYPVKNLEPLLDETRLFTASSVTPASGHIFSAIDPEQALQHFVRTKELNTLHASDLDAEAMAQAFALRYATPRTRIPSLVVQPAGYRVNPLGMWTTVLGHEISHRLRTVEMPLGDTSTVTREHFVEGISHSIQGADWQISISVSPADLDGDVWLLGRGQLDHESGLTTTRLGW